MVKKIATALTAVSLAAMFKVDSAFAALFDTAEIAGTSLTNVDTQTSAWAQLGTIINYFLTLVGLVVFIFLLYGGVILLTAQGNDEKVTEARKIIMYAIAGAIVVVLAYAINAWIFGAPIFLGGG